MESTTIADLKLETEWVTLTEVEVAQHRLPELPLYNHIDEYWWSFGLVEDNATTNPRISERQAIERNLAVLKERQPFGFRLSELDEHRQMRWEKEFAVLTFGAASDTPAIIRTHRQRFIALQAERVSAWYTDTNSIEGFLEIRDGERFLLCGSKPDSPDHAVELHIVPKQHPQLGARENKDRPILYYISGPGGYMYITAAQYAAWQISPLNACQTFPGLAERIHGEHNPKPFNLSHYTAFTQLNR